MGHYRSEMVSEEQDKREAEQRKKYIQQTYESNKHNLTDDPVKDALIFIINQNHSQSYTAMMHIARLKGELP